MKKYIKANSDGASMWGSYIDEIERETSDCVFSLDVKTTVWKDDVQKLIFDVVCNGEVYDTMGIMDDGYDIKMYYDSYRNFKVNSIEDGVDALIRKLRKLNDYIIEDQKKRSVKTKSKSRSTFLLCLHCIDAIRSRGERVKIYKGQIPEDMLREPTNAEIRELGLHDYDLVGQCVWCEDVYPEDDLRRASF